MLSRHLDVRYEAWGAITAIRTVIAQPLVSLHYTRAPADPEVDRQRSSLAGKSPMRSLKTDTGCKVGFSHPHMAEDRALRDAHPDRTKTACDQEWGTRVLGRA
jgi:hypothetical protein